MKSKKMSKAKSRTPSAAEYLRQPYSKIVVADEDVFRAEVVEFQGCFAVGDTESEALAALSHAAESWIEAALEMGQEIPPPLEPVSGYSGKLVLRMPRSLHRKAAFVAQREGVSLNQFIVNSLAEQMGGKTSRADGPGIAIRILSTSARPPVRREGSAFRIDQWDEVFSATSIEYNKVTHA